MHPYDQAKCDKNDLVWKEANNKGPNTITNNNNNHKRKKLVPHQWRPPIDDEKNKRFVHGKPYTWNGRSSWIKDNTPDSSLESPTDIAAAAASAAAITILGQKNAAAAIAAAAMAGKSTNFPTLFDGSDDATAINRIQANLGTTVGQMTSYLGGLNIKE